MIETIPKISKHPLLRGVVLTMIYITYVHYFPDRRFDIKLDQQFDRVSERLEKKLEDRLRTMEVEVTDQSIALQRKSILCGH